MIPRPRNPLAVAVAAGVLLLAAPSVAGEWRTLFDGKTLGRWQVVDTFDFADHGKVEVKAGQLYLAAGQPGTGIRFDDRKLPKGRRLPRIDYEVELQAMRVEGDDFFCGLTFPVGRRALSLIVGGWGGEVVGLSCIDDEPAVENLTCDYIEFDQRRWYKIRVRVTQAKVEAWIDDKQIVDFEIGDHKLSIWFEKETTFPLGIATWRTTAVLRNIRLRELADAAEDR